MPRTGNKKIKEIRFKLDGRELPTDDSKQLAAALLRLGGLDPGGYDLAEIRHGQTQPKRYTDDEQVHVKDGDEFVSIRQRAEVA